MRKKTLFEMEGHPGNPANMVEFGTGSVRKGREREEGRGVKTRYASTGERPTTMQCAFRDAGRKLDKI